MSSMFNPPHPGLTLRDDILPALDLQVGEAAAQLGVDRTTLSKVVNGRAAISPSMVLRIERWLGRDHGGAAEVWLAQQDRKSTRLNSSHIPLSRMPSSA